MKILEINTLNSKGLNLQEISHELDNHPRHEINIINWEKYPYLPSVDFAMAWNENHLFLKYYVKEKHAGAVTDYNNGPVWQDSCCEFFVSPDDQGYYNLEINCIAAALFGWHGVENQKASEQTIALIERSSTLGNTLPLSVDNAQWELVVKVPVVVFFRHPSLQLSKGFSFRANFYKCGDKTKIPHFVSWNPIIAPEPSFHQPEYFGRVILT
jgi:hypothetical protein